MKALLLLLALPMLGHANEPVIGRLFSPAGAKTDSTSQEVMSSRIQVNGAVVRSSNKNTIWLNKRAITEKGIEQISPKTSNKQLPEVQLDAKHRAKVGETVNLDTGERSDMINGVISRSRRTQ